jgi:antagonist of KipI
MSLEVIDVGGLATIQDSGRKGWRQFGVPTSGPMDVFACSAANTLVANSTDCAVFEIGLGDAAFQATQDCVIAVTGVGYKLSIYVWEFPLWSSFFVRAGWKISLNKTDAGMWAYLAASGGVRTQPTLGSRSTYLRGHLGGLEGRPLQPGDVVSTGYPSNSFYGLAARSFPEEARPAYTQTPTIDVIMGPQTKYFTDESIERFLSSEYSISLTSDRMGYRLEGPALTHRNKTELISEGMTFGAVQVPSNGQPIVMMADGPTTGGYPKIGTVASADLPLLAQCVPNKSRIRFRETTVAKAQKKYRALMNGLRNSIVEAD